MGGMRRPLALLVVAGGVALATAPAALAHVDIEPFSIEPGQPARLTFYAPNEGTSPVTELQVVVPGDAELAVAEAVPGWTATVSGRTVTWRGGRIPVGQYGLFSAIVGAPDGEEKLEFRTTLRYTDGFRQEFSPVVFARVQKAPKARDEASRTLGKYSLGLAVAAIALALAAGFLALFTWLRAGDR
jgi:uncharacterized protein YcnI